MPFPTCDNECTLMGWTEAMVETGFYSLHISHDPDADLDGRFKAFCHDTQEGLYINGWMIDHYELIAEAGSMNAARKGA